MQLHRSPRHRRFAAAAALSAATILAATACAPTGATAASLTTDNHIHKLIPSDDGLSLLVGTHNGLFTVDLDSGDVAGPVGEHVIDLMGLTRAGGELLASGHPGASGPQHLQGPNLGLIHSSDAGETWEAVSLEGVADFHSLTYDPAAGTVVGVHAGQILISDDMGATWREGAAADPYDLLATSDGLLLTSIAGLSVSTDTGESFQPVEGAPPLVLLANAEDTVIGVDLDGTLWRSEPGMQWAPVGTTPGQFHALTVLPGGEVIVATEAGLQRTSDLGQSWEPLIS
ncbi:WD40/YVTN/BNR-like repeat-containing protein [Agrococcus sp. Ld7]|uniref:WD40/YVTN/BNR-like repeat-containing protein n=1 Tax=Agrococcus sp. Ld7 TaxID=649148 RepID=UPI00386EC613